MFIKITPSDTLFFRTGRPYKGGEETWADVIFPPSPSTLYGAIRSFLIFERGSLEDFYQGRYKEDLGTPDEKGSLKTNGPFLYKDEIFLKTPLDLVLVEDEELKPLKFSEKPPLFISNYKLDRILIWQKDEDVDNPEGWLSLSEFCNYLKNEEESYLFLRNEDFFNYEHKIGIRRDRRTLTSEDGYLYRIPLIRMHKSAGLVVDVNGIKDFPEKGVIQLGGESKGASFKKIYDPFKELKEMNFDFRDDLFKLYIATPAIFEKGWLPKWIDESNLEGSYNNGIRLKLLGCAIGRPVYIGGWDIAGGRPKPMRKAVPQGSVYYFKILNGDKDKIKETFHFKNISDINPEEGFGLSIIGEVKL